MVGKILRWGDYEGVGGQMRLTEDDPGSSRYEGNDLRTLGRFRDDEGYRRTTQGQGRHMYTKTQQ